MHFILQLLLRRCLHFLYFLWVFKRASPPRSLLSNLPVLCWSTRHAARSLSSLFVLLSSQIIAASSTWVLCPPQAGQRSSHHPLVRLPPASVLPLACFPVATEACHVSAGSCWSALVFNKSSYVCEGRVEGTDNNNHYYSPSKGYLAFTGALTDRSLTRSRGQVLCLWQEKGPTLETGKGFIYKGQKKKKKPFKSSNIEKEELHNQMEGSGSERNVKSVWITEPWV